MDSTAEMTVDFDQLGDSKDSGVVEMGSIKEVGERLKKLTPGVVVIDNDFTLKTKEFELGMGRKEPGRMPDESIELLKNLTNDGWKILVVSNQPKEGHQVARWVRGMKKENYPIFPGSVTEVLGKEGVDGGGKDFLWKKYKNTPEAVDKTTEWVKNSLEKVFGQIYFVGDRQSDIDFAEKVKNKLEISGVNRNINKWKVKGLELSGIFRHLEKFIP